MNKKYMARKILLVAKNKMPFMDFKDYCNWEERNKKSQFK